jgi:hypothetical protein
MESKEVLWLTWCVCVCVCVCERHHGGATGMCVLRQAVSVTRQTVISQEISRGVTNVDDLTPARLPSSVPAWD